MKIFTKLPARVAGLWVYLYRAIDQYGQVIDVMVSESGIWRPPAGFAI